MAEQMPLMNRISQNSQKNIQEKTISISYGDGAEQIAAWGLNAQRDEWQIQYNGLTDSERNTLLNEWRRLGTTTTMEWQAFGDIAPKQWRYTGSYKETNPTGFFYNVSLSVKQVFDL